jgi:hypothetical protein
MPRRRVVFVAIALVAVGAAALAAWRTRLLWLPLPDPAAADATGVVRWLVLRDLSAEPAGVQVELVNRVEKLLDEPPGATVASVDLPQGQLEQAQRNVEHLKELWFYQAVEKYHRLDEPRQRWAFLDRQIERISRWMQWDKQLMVDGTAPAEGSWSGFFAAIERWADKANPALKDKIWAAVKAGLIRWLATSDVARQTEAARTKLALEIEKQIEAPLKLSKATEGFSPGEEARFRKNVEGLAEAWFRYQARRHAAASPREQAQLVAQHLRRIEQFSPYLEQLAVRVKPDSAEGEDSAVGAGIGGQVERWIARAPAEEQPAMRRLWQHLVGAMLLGKVESFFRSS